MLLRSATAYRCLLLMEADCSICALVAQRHGGLQRPTHLARRHTEPLCLPPPDPGHRGSWPWVRRIASSHDAERDLRGAVATWSGYLREDSRDGRCVHALLVLAARYNDTVDYGSIVHEYRCRHVVHRSRLWLHLNLPTLPGSMTSMCVSTAGGEEMRQWKEEWTAPTQGLVTNHETGRVHLLSPKQLQEMRTRVGGSQTGYWPVPSALLRENDRAKL
eukprot:COSAG06_NODE_1426_length_9494_cov_8.250985_7_plen_218_part_00